MRVRIFRTLALLLCVVALSFFALSCKNESDEPELLLASEELANPFADIEALTSATLTELVKTENDGYTKHSVKNIHDAESFLNMLKKCKFFDDSKNIEAVELSYLISLDDMTFFLSSDLSHIYISLSDSNELFQRDVEAYRVEGFGGMGWDLLLEMRPELTGFSKQLEDVVGINVINDENRPLNSIVSGLENVEGFYNMIKSCTRTEAEEQPESTYKYYCTVANMKFKLSEDLGGYRYMCDIVEREKAGSAIEFVTSATYRVEGFDNEYFKSLLDKRGNSFFHSMKYLDLDAITDGSMRVWMLTREADIAEKDVYALRNYLSGCEFEFVRNYKDGDILPNGSYFAFDTVDYTFYVSPIGTSLVVLPRETATQKGAMVYKITGLNATDFNKYISTLFVGGYRDSSSFRFWEFKEEDFQ